MLLLPTWLATQAHAADAPPPPPLPRARAGAPPADAPAGAGAAASAYGATPGRPQPPLAGPTRAYKGLRSLEKNVNELSRFSAPRHASTLETVLGGVIGASRA
jgi:hypothetical protein